jgi:hypothetical protein
VYVGHVALHKASLLSSLTFITTNLSLTDSLD